MDLTRQPPRRPSNANMGGIVSLGRMADKARGHNDELLGEFVYGDNSGLDREVLEFIGMSADEFAAAADELDDQALGVLILEESQRSPGEIETFNREHLEREPQDERHRQMLKDRVAAYAPGSTDIRTGFQSIELDDWGAFRESDLTARPPRTPYLRSVIGLVGGARMADKARARRAGKLGEYKYGDDSGLDRGILAALGMDEATFLEGAYQNPNDTELGEWICARGQVSQAKITAHNAHATSYGLRTAEAGERFLQRRREICPERTDIETFLDLIDLDDQQSFGIVDLNRRAPRNPYDTGVGGIVALARMVDKGRAHLSGHLGTYWFGSDSGVDKGLLRLLKLDQSEFEQLLEGSATDQAVEEALGDRLKLSPEAIEAFNKKLRDYGPTNEAQWANLRKTVARHDATRTELVTYFATMALEDEICFARLRVSV